MKKRIIIRNGVVLDPLSGINAVRDVFVEDGKIIGIGDKGEAIDAASGALVVDADGCLVVPGLIDIHTHVFQTETRTGIRADLVGIDQGVTTLVDAGSAGVDNFNTFKTEIIDNNVTRVLSWLNISRIGLIGHPRTELKDLTNLEIEPVVNLIRQNPAIRGIKARMSSSVLGTNGIRPLEIAKKAAREANVPVMVHVGNGPPGLGDIFDLLDKGDIVTHAFHGKPGGIMSSEHGVLPQAARALERGVLLDVGHGTSSFNFQTMLKAKQAGIHPAAISTDIYLANYNGPVHSLAVTMSKLLALGYPLEQVIAAATLEPAKLLRLDDRIGVLAIGRHADISIVELTQGSFDFSDSDNNHLTGSQLLQPKYTIRAGVLFTCK
ncbi:MAG: amidohydrolase/deacetylase family metallohydrolase [Sporomusaceae bacterium]|nr:amidohydrolase/deacetylase family metallohydrolase [Sporomusaceae bacterium]